MELKKGDSSLQATSKSDILGEFDGFVHIKPLIEKFPDVLYYLLMGERGPGKTYTCLEYALEKYLTSGGKEQFAYIRRNEVDYSMKRGATLFDNLMNNGVIERLTNGEYNAVEYTSMRFYLLKIDREKGTRIRAPEPFGYSFALTSMVHDKSSAYPRVTTIIFDEFISPDYYLDDEFTKLAHTISTIKRRRKNVKIFMLGNTVNIYCPYFKDMGLYNVKEMEPGDINMYHYGESRLKVLVYYTDVAQKLKEMGEEDEYFAFNTPKLSVINNGGWEFDIYPTMWPTYDRSDIRLTYYINFDDETVRCDIVEMDGNLITFIRPQERAIRDPEKHYIYSDIQSTKPYIFVRIDKPQDDIMKFIWSQFVNNRVFYLNNSVGNLVDNYLMWCEEK